MRTIIIFLFIFIPFLCKAQNNIQLVLDPNGHSSGINALTFTPDGSTLISGGYDKSIRFWDVETGALKKTITPYFSAGEYGYIDDLVVSNSGKYLFVSANEFSRNLSSSIIRVISLNNYSQVATLYGSTSRVRKFQITNDDKYLIGSAYNKIYFWNISDIKANRLDKKPKIKPFKTLEKHRKFITDIKLTNNNNSLYSCSKDSLFIKWNISDINNITYKQTKLDHGFAKFIEYSEQKEILLLGIQDNIITFLSKDLELIEKISLGSNNVLRNLYLDDENSLLLLSYYNSDTFSDRTDIRAFPSFNILNSNNDGFVHDIETKKTLFNQQSRVLVATAGDKDNINSINIRDAETGELLHWLNSDRKPIYALGFDKNNNIALGYIITAMIDEEMDKTSYLEKSFSLSNFSLTPYNVDTSNFQRVVLDYKGKSLKIRNDDLFSGNYKVKMEEIGTIISYSYTPKGNIAVSSSNHGLMLFNSRGQFLRYFLGTTGLTWSLSVSNDGKYISAAGGDGIIRLWSLDENADTVHINNSIGTLYSSTADGNKGVLINQVLEESDSYAKGLRSGDIIIEINDNKITCLDDYYLLSRKGFRKGIEHTIVFLREGKQKTINVKSGDFVVHTKAVWPLANLFISKNNEWVMWLNSGHYASSANGEQYIGWIENKGVDSLAFFYPMSAFRRQFYNPALVKRTLELGSYEAALAELNISTARTIESSELKEIVPPEINWITPNNNVASVISNNYEFKFSVNSKTDISDIKLIINGRTAATFEDLVEEDSDNKNTRIFSYKANLDEYISSIMADMNDKEKEIELNAFLFAANRHSAITSNERKIEYRKLSNSKAKFHTPDLYVLSIGISKYLNESYNLRFADADAHSIEEIFSTQKDKLFRNIYTKKLVNEDATRANILKSLSWLEKNVEAGDYVVIFIASHGMKEDEMYYILPHDGDHNELRITGVDWADFSISLSKLNSKTLTLLMLDACQSGKLGTNLVMKKELIDFSDDINRRELTSDGKGIVIMASSSSTQLSYENSRWKHGAFTSSIIEVIKNPSTDINQDGIIDIKELDYHTSELVRKITAGRQTTTIQIPSTISRFPLYKP